MTVTAPAADDDWVLLIAPAVEVLPASLASTFFGLKNWLTKFFNKISKIRMTANKSYSLEGLLSILVRIRFCVPSIQIVRLILWRPFLLHGFDAGRIWMID